MRSKFVLFLLIVFVVEASANEFGTSSLLYPQVVTTFYKLRNFQNVWNDRELVRQLDYVQKIIISRNSPGERINF